MNPKSINLILGLVTAFTTNIQAQEFELKSDLKVESDVSNPKDTVPYYWDDLRINLDNGSCGTALAYFSGTTAGPLRFTILEIMMDLRRCHSPFS